MARPRAIRGEVETRLLEALGAGSPIRIACAYAGIAESTYYDAAKRNSEFAEKATRARATAAVRNLELIQRAAPDDWRAAAKALELMFPEDFSPRLRQQVEHTGKDGGAIEITAVREQVASRIARLAAALTEGEAAG